MFDRAQIRAALGRLAELLREDGVEGELCLLGGAVMVLAFDSRAGTRDIDAIFQPAALVREAARRVAEEQGLSEEWLNDGAKGFVSARHDTRTEDLPQFAGLRVTAPTLEYMLAMKCMASRIAAAPGDPSDLEDIRLLVDRLGIETPERALEIVARYYPPSRTPPRVAYLLEDLLANKGDSS